MLTHNEIFANAKVIRNNINVGGGVAPAVFCYSIDIKNIVCYNFDILDLCVRRAL